MKMLLEAKFAYLMISFKNVLLGFLEFSAVMILCCSIHMPTASSQTVFGSYVFKRFGSYSYRLILADHHSVDVYNKTLKIEPGDTIDLQYDATSGVSIRDSRTNTTAHVIMLHGIKHPIEDILSNCLAAANTTLDINSCKIDAVHNWNNDLKIDARFLEHNLPSNLDSIRNISHSGINSDANVSAAVKEYINALLDYYDRFKVVNRYAATSGGTDSASIALSSEIDFLKHEDTILLRLLILNSEG